MRRGEHQYTIRNVPAAVDQALRKKAARSRRSLNAVALDALTKAANVTADARHDLDAFFGSWVADPAVDRALREQRRIDEDLWK